MLCITQTMRSGVTAMSLIINNFLVNSIFPTPLSPDARIEKGCFSETSILYRSLFLTW